MINQERVRDRLKEYYGEVGRGTISKIAARVKVSRQIITGFRKGANVRDSLAVAIDKALDELMGDAAEITGDEDPFLVLGDELAELSRFMRSRAFSRDEKMERLTYRIAELTATKESLRSKLGGSKKSAGKT